MALFSLSDLPTVLDLQKIEGADGLNVFDTIGAEDYKMFGLFLLNDKNGKKVDLIEKKHRADGASAIVRGIFDDWLGKGTGQTYQHVIDCLTQAGIGAFAAQIKAMAGKEKDKIWPVGASSETPRSRNVATDDDDDNNETPLFELTPTFKRDNNPLPPPSDESKREAVKEFAKKVRVVIQTCNDPEYYAALEKLESPRIENQAFAKPVKYPHQVLTIVVGTFADFDAAVIKTEQGSKCKNELEAVFNIFTSAKLLLGLGVCYGLKKDLIFADVLVGKEIDAAQTPKLAPGTMETRAKLKEIPISVQKLFCENADIWDDFCVCEEPNKRIAKACVGRIFSTSVLINDPVIKQELAALRYLGGEMEGWAQIEYTPEEVKSIIIKGIADFADGTKDKTWQLTAAMAAVDYAHFKLKEAGYINFDEI